MSTTGLVPRDIGALVGVVVALAVVTERIMEFVWLCIDACFPKTVTAVDEGGVRRFKVEGHPATCCTPCAGCCACSEIQAVVVADIAVLSDQPMEKAEKAYLKKANVPVSSAKEKWSIFLCVIISIIVVIIAQATAGGVNSSIFSTIWRVHPRVAARWRRAALARCRTCMQCGCGRCWLATNSRNDHAPTHPPPLAQGPHPTRRPISS